MTKNTAGWSAGFAATLLVFAAAPSRAELSSEELAKIAQNPVGNLISVPFQDNINLNTGPLNGTQNILNIQPVVPLDINSDWNIITRTILPIVSQPSFVEGENNTSGIGNLQLSAFLSPAKPGNWIWGAGFISQMPTQSNLMLGNNRWGLGPTFVVLHLEHGSPWVYGVLLNNVWSVSGSSASPAYNNGLAQPFLNYNFKDGTYLTSSPIITVNWYGRGGQQVTLPVGGGVGHIFHLGKLPVNTSLSGYYNAVRPDNVGNWQIRAQVQLMFPK